VRNPNAPVARALGSTVPRAGLTLPENFLSRADQMIE
jgi:hypothetical protein